MYATQLHKIKSHGPFLVESVIRKNRMKIDKLFIDIRVTNERRYKIDFTGDLR